MNSTDYSKLADARDMWAHLRFEPWEWQNMRGVSRVITLAKNGLIGTVAKYYVWDYIVWEHAGNKDMERLFRQWRPKTDVMTQRFLFVGDINAPLRRIKGYWLGFLGYIEIYNYRYGGEFHPKIKDIIPPVDFVLGGGEVSLK